MTTHHLNYTFSPIAKQEFFDFIKKLDAYEKLEQVSLPNHNDCPALFTEIETMRTLLETSPRILIIQPINHPTETYTIAEQRIIGWIIGNLLGTPLIQNEAGDQVICVYDRDRNQSMAQGARYHQTREGGTIHTDNVNAPTLWDYLILSCIQPAFVGGETILVDGIKVHQILKEHYPDVLTILEQDFIWEKRGISDETYKAPIISYTSDQQPLFRHLRPYMESAHRKTNIPLTKEQLYALDTLDAVIEHSDNQYRHTLKQGELLLTYDAQVFHGRTCFSDALDAVSIIEHTINPTLPIKRTMDRLWIKK